MTAASTHSNDRADASSMVHIETMSNDDLYCMTPPAYAASAAQDEVSIDAENALHLEDSKRALSESPNDEERGTNVQVPAQILEQESITPTSTPLSVPAPRPTESPPVYFQALAMSAAAAHIKKCSIFPNRQAVWLVKKRNMALSPLAAAVLTKEGLLRSKDLELISQSAGLKRDPMDPLSAVAFGVHDTVGDVLLGLVEGPVAAYKHFNREEQQKRKTSTSVSSPATGVGETSPFIESGVDAAGTNMQDQEVKQPIQRNSSASASPNAIKEVAISTGKGFGRIIGASVKAPMTFTHGLTRGFHNVPKLYGDQVRETENVTDLRSGLRVSAKGVGYGIYDGIEGFLVQPVKGAREQGAVGFAKGVGKGFGDLVCKPAAGACGIVGYSSVGVYKEIQKLRPANRSAVQAFMTQGEAEYSQAPESTRMEAVRRYCQVTMVENS
ncbi:hypothetical protein BCR34DRAFT_668648 [Clohesyomyces aquaticus]|uniref:Glycosyltransferase family 1 protein n=1 Tax=Clohesyomyces aquaticus TaxID=1231657 RepID=A0A1Y1YL27_9PLEO|nr:hypothetical protein BCR34DRAFT_668648 [Clohesyomyces aquaticus]